MSQSEAEKTTLSKHFFRREGNGKVKLRINLSPELASLIEEAAGTTPLMLWVHGALSKQASRDVREARKLAAPPPE